MTTPDQHAHVAGSWLTSLAGWAVYVWTWFKGDGSDGAALVMAATLVLTVIKIAQEIRAWRARDEERQALRKLWERMGRKTRPAQMYVDSKSDNHQQ